MVQSLSSPHCCGAVSSVHQWQLEFRACNLSKPRRRHNRITAGFIVLNDPHSIQSPHNSKHAGAEFNPRHVKWIPPMSPPQFSIFSSSLHTEIKRDAFIASSSSSAAEATAFHPQNSAVLTVEENPESDDRLNSLEWVEDLTEYMDGEEDEQHVICEGKGDVNVNVNVFELAFHLHSARTEHDVNEVLKDKPRLPHHVHASLIRIFAREKNLEPALALVKWMEKKTDEASRPNEFVYNNLLLAVKKSLQHERADEIIAGMIRRGLSPTSATYNILMSIYTEMGSPEKALDVFDTIRTPSTSSLPTYVTALRACGKLNDGIRAVDIFLGFRSEFSEKGASILGLQYFTTNVCRGAILKRLEDDDADAGETYVTMLLKKLDDAGIRSGRRWHDRLVWACKRPDQCRLARSLYVRARDGCVGTADRVSAGMCNHVMRLMGKAKKFWLSLRIFEEMIDGGPAPTASTLQIVRSHYEILLTNAGTRGYGRLSLRLLERMERQGIKPASQAWDGALAACSRSLDVARVVEVFRRMVECGVTPTISSYVSLLSALEKRKLLTEAVRICGHVRRTPLHSAHAYTVMGSVYAAAGEFDALRAMVDEMGSSGLGPDVVTYNAIINACAREWGSTLVFGWFDEMRDRLIAPNEGTYEVMIRAVARDGRRDLALQLFYQATKLGFRISRKAYETVFQSSPCQV